MYTKYHWTFSTVATLACFIFQFNSFSSSNVCLQLLRPCKKNASTINGKNFQMKSMQSKGLPQLKQSTTAISRVLISNMQFRESEVEKKYCDVKSQWHSYSSTLSYVDSVKLIVQFPMSLKSTSTVNTRRKTMRTFLPTNWKLHY